MLYKLRFVLLGLLLSFSAQSQDHNIYFQSGTVNLDPAAFDKAEFDGTVFQFHYHVLVQFNGPVDLSTWKAKGLVVSDYIPSYAYFMQVPQSLADEFFAWQEIRGVYKISQEWKIQRDILRQDPPYWIVLGNGLLQVQITFFQTLPTGDLQQVRELLDNRLLNIEASPYPHTIKAVVNQEDIPFIASYPFVQYVAPTDAPAEPENYQARTDHRSNFIATDYAGGLNYNGNGIRIMMNDDGNIGPHIDYQGRLNQMNAGASAGNHGDHVAGIIMGTGNLDPTTKGQSWGADLWVYDYPDGLYDFPSAYTDDSLLITSSSYSDGCNTGYTSFSQLIDQTTRNHRSLMHVFSSGNNGSSDCGYGAGGGWGNITGGHKASKNCIAVGNVNNVDGISGSSSRGPVHDGRIKPDVVAVGSSVRSTIDPNTYDIFSGTSMACPATSGTLGQLYQVYEELNGMDLPPSALMKGALMNTADDLGNPGPDFIYGYGRINARRAYKTISGNNYFRDSVNTGGTETFTINVPVNASALRVMIYWHDPAAAPNSSVALVNDLNLTVTDPGNVVSNPWILDYTPNPANLNANAVMGIDSRNNVEQVTLANPVNGNYTVTVNGLAVNSGGYQEFFVVYEILMTELTLTYPIGGEGFTPNESVRTRWDYYGAPGNFTLQYSTNDGSSWTNIATNIPPATRYYDWTVPNITDGQVQLKIIQGGVADESDTSFSIINLPFNITFDTICGSQVTVRWNTAGGATGYEVYQLGQKYMELKGTTTNLYYTLNTVNTLQEQWFSVLATGPDNARSRRAVAVQLPTSPVNCTLTTELALSEIVSPEGPVVPACFALTNTPVIINLYNNGQNALSNFQLRYALNGNISNTENFSGSIPGNGGTASYTFTQTVDISAPGNYELKVWIIVSGDQNIFNDTLESSFTVSPVPAEIPSFAENFETFNLCSTASNCGFNVCDLANEWVNPINGTDDDIDWRTNDGSTPSSLTGPDQDYNPGTAVGNYVYLEASNCFGEEGILLSPCIDLSNGSGEFIRFAYHMYGTDMGELHLDIFANNAWIPDIRPAVSGNQGNGWKTDSVSLAAYSGQAIQIRFRGITGGDYASDIALDDIGIENIVAGFSVNTPNCVGAPVTFTNNSAGNSIASYAWNFGAGASPATAAGPGPHVVTYSTPGAKAPTLTVTNAFGQDVHTGNITIDAVLIAAFSTTTIAGNQVNFQTNFPAGTTYLWNFGDGNTSAIASPSHTYGTAGTYTVQLIVSNACGADTITQQVSSYLGLEEQAQESIQVFPNPTKGIITVRASSFTDGLIHLTDMTGRTLRTWNITNSNGETVLDITAFAAGNYILEIGEKKFSIVKN